MLDIKINVVSSLPAHHQICVQIRKAIVRGDFRRGSKLPSVKKVCSESASPLAWERACSLLVEENLLSYTKGEGYYVSNEQSITNFTKSI